MERKLEMVYSYLKTALDGLIGFASVGTCGRITLKKSEEHRLRLGIRARLGVSAIFVSCSRVTDSNTLVYSSGVS